MWARSKELLLGRGSETQASIANTTSSTSIGSVVVCKICADSTGEKLFEPCRCSGSMSSIHHSCLVKWLAMSGRKHCEICTYKYRMSKAPLPNLFHWKRLEMNDNEKATFTSLIICSIWFLTTVWYIIVQRIRIEDEPELMGPLYTVSYGMYLFVDFLILINWWRDYSTLADYIQKWRLLNSQMKVLPFKKDRKQTVASASLISLRIAHSTRISPSDESHVTVDPTENVREPAGRAVRVVQSTQESQ